MTTHPPTATLNAPFEAALAWLEEHQTTTTRSTLLVHFTQQFGRQLASVPPPVGAAGRACATELFRRVDELAAEVGTVAELRAWQTLAARLRCLPPPQEQALLEHVLRNPEALAGSGVSFLFRKLQEGIRQPHLLAAARRQAERWLTCSPSCPAEEAVIVVRRGLPVLDSGSAWPAAARQIAYAFCALDQGINAAPYLQAAAEAGLWPEHYRYLLAYPFFAAGNYGACAALMARWPHCDTSSPAEPGARLRCGLALLRLGEIDAAVSVLRQLIPRYGWVVANPLSFITARSGLPPESRQSTNSLPPEPWQSAYWEAAASSAEGTADQRDAAVVRLLELATCDAGRRWARGLLSYFLESQLQAHHWSAAADLLELAERYRLSLLPLWQVAIVRTLAERPVAAETLEAWFWDSLSCEDLERLILAAALAGLVCSSHASELAQAAYLAAPAFGPLLESAETAARLVIRATPPAVLRQWLYWKRVDPSWQDLVRSLVPERQAFLLLQSSVARDPETLGEEPLTVDASWGLLAAIFLKDLKALRRGLQTPPVEGELRSQMIYYLGELIHHAWGAERLAAEGFELGPLDSVTTIPTAGNLPQAYTQLVAGAKLGRDAFCAAWASIFDRPKSRSCRALVQRFKGDVDLSEPGTLFQDVLSHLSLTWELDAPVVPVLFDESDLQNWAT